jgi:indole-3-glycerol phosphate synthase
LEYAAVGSAVISVLTEFKHFKGKLDDMKTVRLATQKAFGDARPAVLRKDFILDRYQLYEARAYGADTVLLIVAVLGVNQLKDLISTSRKLGMEPLVEVHTQREMVSTTSRIYLYILQLHHEFIRCVLLCGALGDCLGLWC